MTGRGTEAGAGRGLEVCGDGQGASSQGGVGSAVHMDRQRPWQEPDGPGAGATGSRVGRQVQQQLSSLRSTELPLQRTATGGQQHLHLEAGVGRTGVVPAVSRAWTSHWLCFARRPAPSLQLRGPLAPPLPQKQRHLRPSAPALALARSVRRGQPRWGGEGQSQQGHMGQRGLPQPCRH